MCDRPIGRHGMTSTSSLSRAALVAAPPLLIAFLSLAPASRTRVGANASGAISAAENDIAGVVTGPKGAEAGVWVIAETADLPTKFVKIVVTDDRGRYVIPELPNATYSVWVRGYGLMDSPKIKTTASKTLNLTAIVALDAKAAAQYYPAGYWFSLL